MTNSPADRSPIAVGRGNPFLDGLYGGSDEVFERLYAWLIGRLRAASGVEEEGVHWAFEKLLENLDALVFTHEGEVKRWLLVTALNHIRDAYRREKRLSTPSDGDLAYTPEPAQDPSGMEDRWAARRQIVAILRTLDPDERRLLYLRAIQELDWAEIARRMKMTPNNARTRYCRLRKRVADTVAPPAGTTLHGNTRGAKC